MASIFQFTDKFSKYTHRSRDVQVEEAHERCTENKTNSNRDSNNFQQHPGFELHNFVQGSSNLLSSIYVIFLTEFRETDTETGKN